MTLSESRREWQVPGPNATEGQKLGWLNESCEEGQSWQKSQRGYDDWNKSLDILSGQDRRDTQEYRSKVSGNRLKINIEVAISGLSAIRPWGGYQATKAYSAYANFMNLTTRALYLNGFWDQDIKSALQWSAVTCTGFIRPVYRRGMAGQGHGNIKLDSFGMPSVLPNQMPSDGDYQRAYCVTLMDEKPIWEAHGMFPDHQDRLKPTNSQYWYSAKIRQAARGNALRNLNPFKRKTTDGLSDNLIPIRYSTINDLSVNTTGQSIPMGEPGSPWAYDVPSFNTDISAGLDFNGNATFRKATANDARMYPYRRLIISSENCVLYDGPAFNWHGELDLIPFCLNRWPWEPIGFSMVHDGYSLQQGIDQIHRGNMDKIIAGMDRPMAYDINSVTKREAMQVDLMQPRQRVGFDGSAVDKPFSQIAPDDVYRVDPESMVMLDKLEAALDYTLQTRDIVELGKARALGKGVDQLEALISANGPRVKDMSRGMEKGVCALANQVKFLILQYMDTSRLIGYVTEANVPQIFDYDPASLVPSHLPGEEVERDSAEGKVQIASPTARVKRARWFAQNLQFTLTPHSIHEIHQMPYRLMLMQLKQRGFEIAECDILEANDIPDVERADGNTTQERSRNEQKKKIEFMAQMQVIASAVGLDLGNAGGGVGPPKPEGRPPTAQAAPTLKVKGDGRPVISESG